MGISSRTIIALLFLLPVICKAQLPNPDDYSWTQVNANMGYPRDGVIGHFFADSNRLYGGWLSGSSTWKRQYSSIDGNPWINLLDAPWKPAHWFANTKTRNNDTVYKVLGDPYNVVNEGTYDTSVYYTTNGRDWTKRTDDCGLGQRWGGAFFQDRTTGYYYYIAGQLDFTTGIIYNDVWVSKNGCASFTKINTTLPFRGGNLMNSIIEFPVGSGRYIKIGGSVYDNNTDNRIYPREIFEGRIVADSFQFTQIALMPIKMYSRHYEALLVFDNLLWFMCGYNSWRGANITDIWCSDDGKNWAQQSPTAMPGRHAQAGWVNTVMSALFISNGTVNAGGGSTTADVWKMTHN